MAKRVTYSAGFKKKVALAAIKDNKTLSEIAQEFKVHPGQIVKWKSQALEGLESIFEDGRKKKADPETDIEAVYAQLGKVQSQLEFLKKNRD